MGATSNPLPGFERRGPGSIYPLGPGTFIRTDHLTQQPSIGRRRSTGPSLDINVPLPRQRARPIRAIQYVSRSEPQVWTSERRVGALSGTLSCFAVTHPVPPVCDRCLQTGGVSLAHARALVAPPSLCIFHTAIFRRRMVLARVQDWASSAAVPFDGRPQGGGHLESTARVRAEGPWIYLSVGPRYLH